MLNKRCLSIVVAVSAIIVSTLVKKLHDLGLGLRVVPHHNGNHCAVIGGADSSSRIHGKTPQSSLQYIFLETERGVGPEDIAVSSTGAAFVSSDDRTWMGDHLWSDPVALMGDPKLHQGSIVLLDLTQQGSNASNVPYRTLPITVAESGRTGALKANFPADFHPHGIALREAGPRDWSLFVVTSLF